MLWTTHIFHYTAVFVYSLASVNVTEYNCNQNAKKKSLSDQLLSNKRTLPLIHSC